MFILYFNANFSDIIFTAGSIANRGVLLSTILLTNTSSFITLSASSRIQNFPVTLYFLIKAPPCLNTRFNYAHDFFYIYAHFSRENNSVWVISPGQYCALLLPPRLINSFNSMRIGRNKFLI